MCGIVGLLIRDRALEARLGELVVPMIAALDQRGPDSAGIATYSDPRPTSARPVDPEGAVADDGFRLSVRRAGPVDWHDVASALAGATGRTVALSPGSERDPTSDCAVLEVAGPPVDLRHHVPSGVHVIGWGRSLEIVKGVGRPGAVCADHGIEGRTGHLAVAHTRMATESAVTAGHCHPFVPGPDLSVVHNGSFSNHASVRRALQAEGIEFETDNDSEVAARHLAAHLDAGDSLSESVRWLMKDLDGFFTLVVATADELSVVRDAFACKPAVVAETAGYVAVASEYRALARLPGIASARVFEPQPEEVHTWTR
jgi:glutamate synthase domain-containing protein 1